MGEPKTFIDENPMLKKPLLAVLELCDTGEELTRGELEQAAGEVWDPRYTQSASVCIDVLVRKGALVETLSVDGVPYAGKLEDMQRDESVSDDACIEDAVSITEFGHRLCGEYAPQATLKAAFDRHPEYAHIYSGLLSQCDTASGKTRSELEEYLMTFDELGLDPETRTRRIYPQFFLDEMEREGGLEWDGAWKTTDAGRAMASASGTVTSSASAASTDAASAASTDAASAASTRAASIDAASAASTRAASE